MSQRELVRGLGLGATTSLVVGTIIGTGVFLKSAKMAQAVGTPELVLLAWIAAGILSLAGALSYAELGAMLPDAGGEYVYLRAAYGELPAFLFGWMRVVVGSTGSIASFGVAFAAFLSALIPLDAVWAERTFSFLGQKIDWKFGSQQLVAVGVILFFSGINCLRVSFGGRVQAILTLAKVLAIATIIGGVFFFAPTATWQNLRAPANVPAWNGFSAFGAAMLAALWAFDGWNNMPMAAGEVQNPGRNVPRALILGMAIVLAVYGLVNLAYCYALPIDALASARSTAHPQALPVAAMAAKTFLPKYGAGLVALAALLSTVGVINGSILTGARVPYAMARDGLLSRRFAKLNEHSAVPATAILFQGIWASVLAVSGTFDQLTDCVVFAGMIFYGTTTAAVFVLRKKRPDLARPYKTLGYPLVPILFVVVAVWLLANTLYTSPLESVAGLVLIGLGLPIYFWQRRSAAMAVAVVFLAIVTSAKAETQSEGGIIRGPQVEKKIALEFTANEFTDGVNVILDQLAERKIKASFFLTGKCVRTTANAAFIKRIVAEGHYLGPHSDSHTLLCPWEGPKKTLVTKDFFQQDLSRNLKAIESFGVPKEKIRYFIPPYEWYNEEIAAWTREMRLQIVNFTPGTRANADYTEEAAKNFVSSQAIFDSVVRQEKEKGLNGYLLMFHAGSGPGRKDKMYLRIGALADYLQGKGYQFVRVDELLSK